MKKSEAINLAKETFDGEYNEQSFRQFISNLFKGNYSALDKTREGSYIREAFRQTVKKYRILGNFEDAEGNSVDILEVTLQKEGSLERARTAQRNFVADYLKNHNSDAALVAFLSPEQMDWRFSLVKLEYSLEEKEGKVKTQEELTPAKRWSFLVGRNEGSHTVKSRFISLLAHDVEPTFRELEEAFNIERVTDEFFEKYCDLFFRMKESLDALIEKDSEIKADFESKELSSVDFAKKTLGQMAFLYFLQKKGWFGVAPNKDWGSGPKDFLRQLFIRRDKYGQNFFDDVLEPLFYEALAQDRGVEAIYPRLNNCRMPFLNGGLFEPMNGYSWETTNIRIPDHLFSNENKTHEGDIGDGILDIFDRYNFTVNENEPLEKEVAVDPEMLGKVFENLLEIRDRKSKGAFYTPREIVHYMCQESLINYLDTNSDSATNRQEIETLIRLGSQIIQNDALVLAKGREGTYKFLLPESIRENAADLDNLLSNIKVCDPAVGSGAFPLGMLTEIIQARQALGIHLGNEQSAYELKLHSISNSIYGVDIDPGAVEIAKLRLWLALVVEETEPHPLPNLEHKIMQGNSLLSEYEGIQLFDDSFLESSDTSEVELKKISSKISSLQNRYFALHGEGNLTSSRKYEIEREIGKLNNRKKSILSVGGTQSQEPTIFDSNDSTKLVQETTSNLQSKIQQYILESRRSVKQTLKLEIDALKWQLIEASLKEQNKFEKLPQIEMLRTKNIRPFFIWKLEFSDVFKENGGFDVVIANPPYGADIDNDIKVFERIFPRTTKSFKDIYKLFFELALSKLVNSDGTIAFITPNTFILQTRYTDLRGFLLEHSLLTIVNLGENVFEAVVPTAVTIASKSEPSDETKLQYADLTQKSKFSGSVENIQFTETTQSAFSQNSDLSFSVDKLSFDNALSLNDILDFKDAGINYQRVKVGLSEKGKSDLSSRLLYEGSQETAQDKMYWKGSDIFEYHIKPTTNRWVRVATKNTLKSNERVILNADYFAKKPKLLWRQTAQFPIAAVDESGIWFGRSVQAGEIKSKFADKISYEYLSALLNSSLMRWIYLEKVKEGGRVFPQVKLAKLKTLPIIMPTVAQLSSVERLVSKIGAIKFETRDNVSLTAYMETKAMIDNVIFDIYEVDGEHRTEMSKLDLDS